MKTLKDIWMVLKFIALGIFVVVICGCTPPYTSGFCREMRDYRESLDECKLTPNCQVTRSTIEYDIRGQRQFPQCFSESDSK